MTALAAVVLALAAASMTLAGSTGAAPKRKPLVVWLEQGARNPYWSAQHRAAAEAGRRLGFELRVVSGNLDPTDQAAILRELVEDERVDLVMVKALDPKSIGPALLYAKARRVPTVFLDGRNPRATASIAFDERRAGRVAAMHALTLIQEAKAPRKVAVLEGIRGQPASDLRAQGFVEFMTRAGVKVVEAEPTSWRADRAEATMRDWLDKHSDLSLVYALSDTLAVPAMNVAERQNRLCTRRSTWKANRSCVAFVSVDGFAPDQVGSGRLFSTELYSPHWTGYTYARLAYQVVTGRRFRRNTVFNSLHVAPENAACVTRMARDMERNIGRFQFPGTLQRMAARYRCKVLDAGA